MSPAPPTVRGMALALSRVNMTTRQTGRRRAFGGRWLQLVIGVICMAMVASLQYGCSPVSTRPPLSRRGSHAPAGDALAKLDALARGNTEQVRSPPHQVALKIGDAAVGIDDLPHHLHDTAATALVERASDQAGKG